MVRADPVYTSQPCNRCRVVDANSRKNQAEFVCTACEHTAHADVNAAPNILGAARPCQPVETSAPAGLRSRNP
ncbi:zinc ribbon domain-containing protein [Streptomyces sp. NPDC058252]|uniref:zinc ribbon domain-containing protein n=1 Tax=Streptomyces sp. NPDC058252 TaxID=3346405 RepID=UPI0036EFE70D